MLRTPKMLTVSETKLSKQQKEILRYLYESNKPLGLVYRSELSWHIAKKFNKGHNDRIWNKDKHKDKLIKEFKESVKDCYDERGMYKDEQARKKIMLEKEIANFGMMWADYRHKEKHLTQKHRASFSRSLRRLEERGLIVRVVWYSIIPETKTLHLTSKKIIGETDYTKYVRLTEKGKEICKQLLE